MPARTLAAVLICVPAIALAEWRYDPVPPPSGRATGSGSGGQSVSVECGNGGLPAVVMNGPRPVGGPEEDYVLQIDTRSEELIFADCGTDGCLLMFEDFAQARRIIGGLQAGNSLSVGFFRNGHGGDIPLRGSSAAIGQVLARECPLG